MTEAVAPAPPADPNPPAPPPPAPPAGDPPPPAPPAPPANDSLLAKPGEKTGEPPAPPAPPADELAWLPEKYRVMNDKGELDLAASSKKLGEGYGSLAKKLGGGEVPPETPEAYQFTPPEQFKDVALDDEMSKGFRERAHAVGITQKQFEFVMGEYFGLVPQVLNSAAQLTAAQAKDELSKVWTTPTEFEAGVSAANLALSTLPEGLRESVWDKFGRDPDGIQLLAAFGKEMREDSPPSTGGNVQAEDIGALLSHPAARDAKHPEHDAISKKISNHFRAKFGDQPSLQ